MMICKKNIFVFFLFIVNISFAQTVMTFSPGIKLGYAFGNNGGFIYGFEATLVVDYRNQSPNYRYGIVTSIEVLNGERRLHFGGQINFSGYYTLFGIELGPTFIIDGDKKKAGLSLTPYFGGFLIPYIRATIFQDKESELDIGTFLKLHVPVSGRYSVG